MTDMRVCSNLDCEAGGQAQPLDAAHFTPDRRYSGGFRRECKRCESRRARTYNKEHREQAAASLRRWQAKNREQVNAYQRKRYRRMVEALKEQTGSGE